MKPLVAWLICLGLLWPPFPALGANAPALVYAPATPGAVPLVLAVREVPQLRLKWFDNHSRAHALFLRKDVQILATGLSVGVQFFAQGAPVRMIGSHVSGLTFLMSDGPARNFRDLRGRTLVLPFEGSPIQEVTRFLMAREGLVWGRDIPIAYASFPATVNRLRQGQVHAAALPEPFVSQLLAAGTGQVAFSYADLWDACTGGTGGYPQVGLFVQDAWAAENRALVRQFMDALDRAVTRVFEDPQGAVAETGSDFPFPPAVLRDALGRTRFRMLRQEALRQAVTDYYRTIGHPLDESFDAFFIAD